MNFIAAIAVALGLPLAGQCGRGTTTNASHLVRWVTDRGVIDSVIAAANTASDDVLCAAKVPRGKKKRKAVNPWPMSDNINEPLGEIIMLGVGLVVVVILGIVAYRNGY